MADEDHFEAWERVPDKSTFLVSVTGTTKTKLIVATIDALEIPTGGGQSDPITGILDSKSGTPFPVKLRSGKIYAIDINLHYFREATATVRAVITDEDGKQFKHGFETSIKRKKGKVDTVVFSINMA